MVRRIKDVDIFGARLDEIPEAWLAPLSQEELARLAPIRIASGKVEVDPISLAKLFLAYDRVRLTLNGLRSSMELMRQELDIGGQKDGFLMPHERAFTAALIILSDASRGWEE